MQKSKQVKRKVSVRMTPEMEGVVNACEKLGITVQDLAKEALTSAAKKKARKCRRILFRRKVGGYK